MAAFVLRRIGASLISIWVVLTLTFCVIQLAPGGPGGIYLDPRVPAGYAAELEALYGLDRPLPIRYVSWLRAILFEWDWGVSPSAKRPVSELLALYAPPTLLLSAAALLVQFSLGLLLGVAAARAAGRLPDHLIRIVSLVLYSLPAFWLGLMAILLLSHGLPLFPSGHTHGIGADELGAGGRLLDRLHHLALPALVLGFATLGSVVRLLRGSLIEVLQQDFVRTARAKGLRERSVVWVHALRNAVGPLAQLLGVSLPLLVSGAVVVETVFSWPGMGRLTWEAISGRDYPVLLATTALATGGVILGSLAADLLHAAADPRVRRKDAA